jgi:hypothetical protein
MEPLVGRKLWFGPRGFGGWGWTPVSWEGWAVTIGFFVIAVCLGVAVEKSVARVATIVLVVIVLGICTAKGTSPGGPKARREFQSWRSQRS